MGELVGIHNAWASSLVWVGRCLEKADLRVRWVRGRGEGSRVLTLPPLKPQVQQCKKEEAAGKKDSKGHSSLLCR